MGIRRDEFSDVLLDAHRAAVAGDIEALRGIWRRQESMFTDGGQLRCSLGNPSVETFRETLGWQGEDATESEISDVQRVVRARLAGHPMTNNFDPTPPRERAGTAARAPDLTAWARRA
jgi:hypothetical protein